MSDSNAAAHATIIENLPKYLLAFVLGLLCVTLLGVILLLNNQVSISRDVGAVSRSAGIAEQDAQFAKTFAAGVDTEERRRAYFSSRCEAFVELAVTQGKQVWPNICNTTSKESTHVIDGRRH